MTNAAPLGIFGGTFDPIHMGHISPVMQAAKVLNIQNVALLPCHISPHKNPALTSSEHRLAMANLVCQQYPIFFADGRELKRNKPSYTIDTLIELRQDNPSSALCFFIGMDSLLSLPNWHRWQELFDYCHFVVCQRDEFKTQYPKKISQLLAQRQVSEAEAITGSLGGKIFIADTTMVPTSSTQLRTQLNKQVTVDSFIPQSVQDYIAQHQLYTETT